MEKPAITKLTAAAKRELKAKAYVDVVFENGDKGRILKGEYETRKKKGSKIKLASAKAKD